MGQRFQIMVKIPRFFINENNPNNKEERLLLYHCQWMYGISAVLFLANFIEGYEELVKEHEELYNKENGRIEHLRGFPFDHKEKVEKIINWICYKDITSQKRIRGYFNPNGLIFHPNPGLKKEKEYNKRQKELLNKGIKEFIRLFDNNNGVLFIDLSNRIKYCYINPESEFNEGKIQGEELSAKEYLKDYELTKEQGFIMNDVLMYIKSKTTKIKNIDKIL